MRLNSIIREAYECVKINGLYRNLTNDEMKMYKQIKEQGKVFKETLPEFDANTCTRMVQKGLLRRMKDRESKKIYFVTRGRKGHLKDNELTEVAPPDKDIESWIRKNKTKFKDRYGNDYEKYLYATAWKKYNGRPLKETFDTFDEYSHEIYMITHNGEE